MSEDDEWVRVAMDDVTLVVETLLKLNRHQPPPSTDTASSVAPLLRLDWTVRQRRSSKQVLRRKSEPTRDASPTTPLSWSAATSLSGGAADVSEELSLAVKPVDTARSKVALSNGAPIFKRSRKKKKLAELKEEENFLLIERINLKNQLVTLQLRVEKQKAENSSLKKMKLDLLSQQASKTVAVPTKPDDPISNQPRQIWQPSNLPCSVLLISAACNKLEPSPPNNLVQARETDGWEPSVLLPDLNLPVEDDSCSNVLYELS